LNVGLVGLDLTVMVWLRSNGWNRLVYACWSPFYDLLAGVSPLVRARRGALDLIDPKPGEEVLLVGVGTGADFELLPSGVEVVGVDLSAAMLKRARRKAVAVGREVRLQEADAMALPFDNGRFDVVVLTLILSVVADGGVALREAVRVTRAGGRLLIFDKFVKAGESPSAGRRVLNLLTSLFGTDINRQFEPMLAGLPCVVVQDEPSLLGGAYRAIVLKRRKD
jgi:phosphatidylethanolamine/phosphatidyl-N-methylethanolamine N-methyltransferase